MVSSSPTPSSLVPALSRPTFARASTRVTLVHTGMDFASSDSLRKPPTNTPKRTDTFSVDVVHRFRDYRFNKPVAPTDNGNLNQAAPTVNVIAPTQELQRRRKKKASKSMAGWVPKPQGRGIRESHPVTGIERFARL